eukprot:Pgem_evm1s252
MEPTLFSGFVLSSMTVNISNNNIDCCSNTEGLHYLIQNNQTIDCLLGGSSTSTTYSSHQNIDLNNDCLSAGLNHSPSPKNNVGVIVGCVIGILVLIAIALVVGFLIYRRKKIDLLEGKTAKEFVLNSNADMMESSAEYTVYDGESALACDKKTETGEANLNIYEEEDSNYHVANEDVDNILEGSNYENTNIFEEEDSNYHVVNEDLENEI